MLLQCLRVNSVDKMFMAVFYKALDQPVMFGRFGTYSDYMLSALSI